MREIKMKQQLKKLNKLGITYASMAKYSGVSQDAISYYVLNENAKWQKDNEKKMKIYLRKLRNTIIKTIPKEETAESQSKDR